MRKRKFTRNVGVMFSEEGYQALMKVTDDMEIPLSEFIRNNLEDKLDELREKTRNET